MCVNEVETKDYIVHVSTTSLWSVTETAATYKYVTSSSSPCSHVVPLSQCALLHQLLILIASCRTCCCQLPERQFLQLNNMSIHVSAQICHQLNLLNFICYNAIHVSATDTQKHLPGSTEAMEEDIAQRRYMWLIGLVCGLSSVLVHGIYCSVCE
jgi:hypothetical protein